MEQASFIKIITAGGPMMAPILLCSFFAVAIVIEKMQFLFSIKIDAEKFKQMVFELIRNNKIKGALAECDQASAPLAKIFKAGILRFGASRDDIKEAMEGASLFEIPKLEERLTALATIAHISPLLGFLGTVLGIAQSFYTIQARSSSLNPVSLGDLSLGIWQALIATVAGLIIAIPSYLFYNYLLSRINIIIVEMEQGATELVDLLCRLSESQISDNNPEQN